METRIDLYMKNLGISREEAITLIADDEADVSVELSKEQAKVVKEMTHTTGDKDKRKTTRKSDADKRLLISSIRDFMIDFILDDDSTIEVENHSVKVNNPEREIQFEFRGALYRLTLAKPRKEK